jgi:hypothetical protein
VGQITLVAYKHDGHVGVGMLPCILQPACQVVESLSPAFGLLLISYGANNLTSKTWSYHWNYEIQRSSMKLYLVMSYTSNAPAAPL